MQNTLKNTLIINSIILIILLIYSLNRKKQSWKLWFFAYLVLLSSIIEQNIEPVCKKPTIYTSLVGSIAAFFETTALFWARSVGRAFFDGRLMGNSYIAGLPKLRSDLYRPFSRVLQRW